MAAATSDLLISQPMRVVETNTRPSFTLPAGACDSHMHVFESLDRYPCVSHPHYTLPDGKLEHYLRLIDFLGIQRFVIVQPSFYGTDNACLIDVLKAVGDKARGVVMIDLDIADSELDRLHGYGVRAVRIDLFSRAELPIDEIVDYIRAIAKRVARLDWHIQFYTPGRIVQKLLPFLAAFEYRFVIDHMGYVLEEDGLTDGDFKRLVGILTGGNGWLKLSGPYRIAKKRSLKVVEPIAKAIVEAAAKRAIWGSDWPHIPDGGRDTGELLNLLATWAPDPADRQRILADNARDLFDWK